MRPKKQLAEQPPSTPSQLRKRINELFRTEDLERVISMLWECAEAENVRWDGVKKANVKTPDWRIRLEANRLLLSYMEGLPVQRQEIVTANFSSLKDLLASEGGQKMAEALIGVFNKERTTNADTPYLEAAPDESASEVPAEDVSSRCSENPYLDFKSPAPLS